MDLGESVRATNMKLLPSWTGLDLPPDLGHANNTKFLLEPQSELGIQRESTKGKEIGMPKALQKTATIARPAR